ncbi:MAG: helix-turn-helix domain-containing protein [Candidatus Omnitrophica bacterium]|nr:helix-turn-helix domain-containing protein [Candidatus Omnitrophota bacterium]
MRRRFLSVEDVAEYLGVSQSAIRKWIRTGQIPFSRLNGAIRFDIEEIHEWTQASRAKAYSVS